MFYGLPRQNFCDRRDDIRLLEATYRGLPFALVCGYAEDLPNYLPGWVFHLAASFVIAVFGNFPLVTHWRNSPFKVQRVCSPENQACRSLRPHGGRPQSIGSFAGFSSRMATLALGVTGVLGAMLSISGVFGVAAYSISKRFCELRNPHRVGRTEV
jgi:hypothetical protein